MKIEVEYEEIEALKDKILELNQKNRTLEEKLKCLDETQLKEQAVVLATDMFCAVQNRVFKELGYPDTYVNRHDFTFGGLIHWLGEKFYDSDKLEVVVGEDVTNMYQAGILRLRIKREKP